MDWIIISWFDEIMVCCLTRCGIQEIHQHWFRKWFVAWSAPNHHLNLHGLLTVGLKWITVMKLELRYQTINENAFENVVCKMAAILFRPESPFSNMLLHEPILINHYWGTLRNFLKLNFNEWWNIWVVKLQNFKICAFIMVDLFSRFQWDNCSGSCPV